MKTHTKKLDVYIGVLNTRSIFVKFLPPTDKRGARIKLVDKYNDNQSKTFGYCYKTDDILQQAIDILYRNGANIICRASTPDFYIINIENWGDEYVKIKDLK